MVDGFTEIKARRERFIRAAYRHGKGNLGVAQIADIMRDLDLDSDITSSTGMRDEAEYQELARYWMQLGYIEHYTEVSIRITAQGITHVEGSLEQQAAPSVAFHIGTAERSIIGTQTHAQLEANINFENLELEIEQRGGEDKEALREALKRIEELVEDRDSIRRGELAEFSEVMEKHSWFTGAVAQALIGFATQALAGGLIN